jgi:uncharacterized protein with von Willebrand factor type A (vWA) domain
VGRRLIHDQKASACFRISSANKTSLSTTDPSRNLLQISALNRHNALDPILVFMQQSISSTTQNENKAKGRERERERERENLFSRKHNSIRFWNRNAKEKKNPNPKLKFQCRLDPDSQGR